MSIKCPIPDKYGWRYVQALVRVIKGIKTSELVGDVIETSSEKIHYAAQIFTELEVDNVRIYSVRVRNHLCFQVFKEGLQDILSLIGTLLKSLKLNLETALELNDAFIYYRTISSNQECSPNITRYPHYLIFLNEPPR